MRLSSLSVCLVCPLTIQLSVLEEAAASQCCRCIVFPQCMVTPTITVSSLSFLRQSVCLLTLTRCIEMRRLATLHSSSFSSSFSSSCSRVVTEKKPTTAASLPVQQVKLAKIEKEKERKRERGILRSTELIGWERLLCGCCRCCCIIIIVLCLPNLCAVYYVFSSALLCPVFSCQTCCSFLCPQCKEN